MGKNVDEEGSVAEAGLTEAGLTEATALVPKEKYEGPWTYKQAMAEFAKVGYPFAAIRVPDILVELSVGAMLSRLGDDYLAANALMIVTHRVFVTTALGALFPIAVKFKEAETDAALGSAVRQGLVYAALLSVVPTLALCFSAPMLKVMHQDPKVADIVQEFYVHAAGSIPGMLLTSVLHQFTLAIGKPRLSLFFNIAGAAVTFMLSYAMTFGLDWGDLHIPEWKLSGSGLAHSISSGAMLLSFFAYLCFAKDFRKYQLFSSNFDGFSAIKGFFKLGVPYGIQVGSDFVLNYMLTIAAGLVGKSALIASRMAEMAYIIPFVMQARSPQATAVAVKEARKYHNANLIRKMLIANMVDNEIMMLAWTAAICGASRPFMGLFMDINDPDNRSVMTLSNHAIWLKGAGMVSEVIRFAAGGTYRGFENTKTAMWNSLLCLNVLGIPLVFLAYALDLGLEAIYGASDLVTAFAAIMILRKCLKSIFTYSQESMGALASGEAEQVGGPVEKDAGYQPGFAYAGTDAGGVQAGDEETLEKGGKHGLER